ncbi:MAG: DUF937 domain-containing protein [Bacteroidota bacterium]|nr:DUF937 domain-containing protein [Bacteroidota bacterium]
MNLTELISRELPDDLLSQIAGQAGIEDENTGVQASKSLINILLQGISKNVSNEPGASGLLSALDRDHDGSILNDVLGMLSGQTTAANPSMLDGAGILGHILGGRKENTANQVGKLFGLDTGTLMKLMMTLAPIVMGLLGKFRAAGKLNDDNVQQVVEETVEQQKAEQPGFGIFGKLLDKDGDGNISDDLLQMGMKFLLKEKV